MKRKQPEPEVDFIGGGRPLTKEDEIAISNYIRTHKERNRKKRLTSYRQRTASSKKHRQLTD